MFLLNPSGVEPPSRFDPKDRWNRFDQIESYDQSKAPVKKSDLGKVVGFIWTMIASMQSTSGYGQAPNDRTDGTRRVEFPGSGVAVGH